MADAKLLALNATELRNRLQRTIDRGKALAEKAQKPLMQGGMGLAIVAGGAAGGVVSGLKPTIGKVPTDLILGSAVALPCLFGAGNPIVDAAAFAGWAMASGGASRLSHDSVRDWRENRAAEDGDAAAKSIVALQKQLNEARAKRDNAKTEVKK